MKLSIKKVNLKLKEYKQIKADYYSSFELGDIINFDVLRFLNWRKNIHFLAFYDVDQFCGFTYFILYKNVTFILYLVINPNFKSKGYGSAILSWIKQQHPNNTLVLYIDEVHSKYEDYTIRQKRLNFYEKNGFTATNYVMHHDKYTYQILINGNEFDLKKFKWAFLKFSFGTNWPKIKSVIK